MPIQARRWCSLVVRRGRRWRRRSRRVRSRRDQIQTRDRSRPQSRCIDSSRRREGSGRSKQVDTLNGGVAGFAQLGRRHGRSVARCTTRCARATSTRSKALLDGGANINDTTSVDHTTPLLMATINGQFDVAMKLIERGANPNIASTAGMTPLYATINAQWAPKSRYPQPQAVQNQQAPYLEVMEALLKAGADPNVRLIDAAVVLRVQQLRQRELRSREPRGHDAVLARGVRGRRRRDEAAGRSTARTSTCRRSARRRLVDAVAVVAVVVARPGGAALVGGGGGGGGGGRGVAALPAERSAGRLGDRRPLPVGLGVYPIHAAAGVGYGNGFAGNSHRHAPDGWMPAMKYLVEELHADVNARDTNGYTPLHHAAARGDNEMIMYLVAHGADVRGGVEERQDDGRHGERSGVSVSVRFPRRSRCWKSSARRINTAASPADHHTRRAARKRRPFSFLICQFTITHARHAGMNSRRWSAARRLRPAPSARASSSSESSRCRR